MQAKEIMVSIVMPVYNHEKYLEKALQSVVKQKTQFAIELLIGEDSSTDKSAQICKKFEEKYPDIVKVFYREENLGCLENCYDLAIKTKGKYRITLEGDDYWCDEHMLQKQVDFLEKNLDYIACCCKFKVIDFEGNVYYDQDVEEQLFKGNIYTKEDFNNGYLASHINTILYRNIYMDDNINTEFIHEFDNILGDITLTALLVSQGKIYCLEDVMSCYRKVTLKRSSSFSAQNERINVRDRIFANQVYLENYFNKELSFEGRKKAVFASAVFKWYREKNKQNRQVINNIINLSGEKFKYRCYFIYLIMAKRLTKLIYKEDRRVKF